MVTKGFKSSTPYIDICLRFGFKVEVVICPDGEDPDSLSKQCDVNDFIENREDAILGKLNFAGRSKESRARIRKHCVRRELKHCRVKIQASN
jgi:hypothetical protein